MKWVRAAQLQFDDCLHREQLIGRRPEALGHCRQQDTDPRMHLPARCSRLLADLAVTLVLVGACIGTARADILIGGVEPMSITPLTGQYAMFGEELRGGTGMAVRDINAGDGVNGEKLRLLIADDACDPKLAVEVAKAATSPCAAALAGTARVGSRQQLV
jgi:ABC-type branched-subunit amino acid transport system substrate-binding protein